MSISSFQDHMLDRIKLHAERVESLWLGSAAQIQEELEGALSQVWALTRSEVSQTDQYDSILMLNVSVKGVTIITERLDLYSSSVYPILSDGFGDVYRANLHDGTRVSIKTPWLGVDSSDHDTKLLKVSNLALDLICRSKIHSVRPGSYTTGRSASIPMLCHFLD
jgi:hypothetical protein